jgi:ATP-dependent Clp protease adaptor protein ClpS
MSHLKRLAVEFKVLLEGAFAMAKDSSNNPADQTSGATATKTAPKTTPKPREPQPLPPWKVLLHNDDVNDMIFVVTTIVALTPLNQDLAVHRTLEAHERGVALLLTTHKERAELYQEQFQTKGLTVTIESAE